MVNNKAFLDDFSTHSPFEAFYKHGIKPEDIKSAIIQTLSPYFQNHNRLEEYATSWLVSGWVNFSLFKPNKWHLDKFEKCLSLFNQAKSQNDTCYSVIVDWVPEINQSLTRFWSFKNLSQDLEQLEIQEYLEENLKIIGQILEGVTKSYLKLLLHLNRLIRNKEASKESIINLDLGVIVDELISTTDFPELFCPPPWDIRLNQWRNISYHHNAKVVGDKIICWYGKEPNIKKISLTRDELTEVVKSIVGIYNTFKNVEFVFVFDNLPEYQEECGKRDHGDFVIREEVELLELFSGINSQGFKVINFTKNDDCSNLILEDLTEEEPRKRAIHSSQFLYHLWTYTQSNEVRIEYRLLDGSSYFISSANGEVCRKISTNEKPIEYLAENATFKVLHDPENKDKNV